MWQNCMISVANVALYRGIRGAVTRRRVRCPPVPGRFHQLAYTGASASVTHLSIVDPESETVV